MRRILLPLALIGLLAACDTPGTTATGPAQSGSQLSGQTAARNFSAVVARMEPVAEAECRARRSGNCDFKIGVDPDPSRPRNAFQTVDRSGQPVIIFTQALIADARNQDELAFILGHEAAHHIERHLGKTNASAQIGAQILGGIIAAAGGSVAGVQAAAQIGGTVGARTFSKEFELEADALGTVIAAKAGYDPVRGAQYFNRVPDPGDRFLGTHPPNQERIAIVEQTAAGL